MNQRQIPINNPMNDLFKSIRTEVSPTGGGYKRPEYVFTRFGTPIKDIREAFRGALKRAGITDFRFHDLRHTFASQMVIRGASLKDVQEILGYTTLTMTLRYAHLSQERKQKAVNLLNDLTDCHKTVTNAKLRLVANG